MEKIVTLNNRWTFKALEKGSKSISQTPSIFFIAERKSTNGENSYIPKVGYRSNNPSKTLDFQPKLNLNADEIILLLKHNYNEIEEQLPLAILLLMTYYPVNFYDFETGKEIILKELKEQVYSVK